MWVVFFSLVGWVTDCVLGCVCWFGLWQLVFWFVVMFWFDAVSVVVTLLCCFLFGWFYTWILLIVLVWYCILLCMFIIKVYCLFFVGLVL